MARGGAWKGPLLTMVAETIGSTEGSGVVVVEDGVMAPL